MPKTKKTVKKTAAAPGRAKAAAKSAPRPASGAHPASPLAPRRFATLPPLAGVRLATAAAGVRYSQRTDVMLALLAPETQVAGVFTRSATASAPVLWCRDKLKGREARVLVVNSGNANAFTGRAGLEGVREIAAAAASVTGCPADQVFMASTGVIGEPLPAHKITAVLDGLVAQGAAGNWRAAAEAIMTTDTYPKMATATAAIGNHTVRINGIAKGSGMIAPDMATMLGFVFTDANLPADILQECLTAGVGPSFNSITVDSDTSTSDTLMLFATGKGARHPAITRANDKQLMDFRRALNRLLLDLALQVVKDGEGATKLIAINVTGAQSDKSAKRVALSIANSPLVKTAVAGGDANWGRVVMAVGKAGEPADRDRLKISFGSQVVADKGVRATHYDEAAATAAVSGPEVDISVDLGLGQGTAKVWTCDLTHGYIDINGSYRS